VNKKKKSKQSYFATVPPQEILPIIDGRYESSVKGLFVVGDVTGLPLVKVAANQGREVIERMEKVGLFKSSAELEGLDMDRMRKAQSQVCVARTNATGQHRSDFPVG